METAYLEIAIAGSPPMAQFSRSPEVPDDLWYAIPVNLGPGVTKSPSEHFNVPIERLLSGRRWLSDACRRHDVGVRLDEATSSFLERAHSEQNVVRSLLGGGAAKAPAVRHTARAGGRFTRRLMPFQERDLAKLLTLDHGANFSVPGAGKTTVTYALYEAEKSRGRVERLIVVAPLSAFDAWEQEVNECFRSPPEVVRFDSGRLDAEVLLVTYQRLASARSVLAESMLKTPTHLVLDEAHRMKRGRIGEWGNICLDLAHLAVRRDILSGTPAPHSPRDFVALTDFVWPGQARTILPGDALRRDPPDDAMVRVNEALHPLYVRTTKSELALEPPVLRVEMVRQGKLQSDIYDALRNRYGGMFDMTRSDAAIFAQMGEVTMYLLEAATNPGLLDRKTPSESFMPLRYPPLAIPPGSHLADLIASYTHHEIPPKFEKLAFIVEENAKARKKTLVWSNFVENLLSLERTFARLQPALVYGGIPSKSLAEVGGARTRESELERFRADERCMVLLANPAATAEGISLHETCHDAIYLDRTFNAGQYLQSIDRIHRLGLPSGTITTITFLLTEGSIDEAVDARVRLKAERLAQMLDDPDLVTMALPDDEDYGEVLDDLGDLEVLFSHLAGDND